MKISKIYIKGFQQFQDVELDFTNPKTGLPLDKVCFIGSNGTGKSKLLNFLNELLANNYVLSDKYSRGSFYVKFLHADEFYSLICLNSSVVIQNYNIELESDFKDLTQVMLLQKYYRLRNDNSKTRLVAYYFPMEIFNDISFKSNPPNSLLIYSPAEAIENNYLNIKDVPETSVNDALNLNSNFPTVNLVSTSTVSEFWKIIVYNLRKRAEDRDRYENLPENLSKIKQQLIEEFDGIEPKVLNYLNNVWDKILNKAGLYFDVEGASNPFQLTDNLKAYIKLNTTNKIIPYNELSTGIRNYIFRVGHIFSMYFNREVDFGFLLVDEPENSLYPDFLFELVEIYQQIIKDKRGENNTQMFFATHNPIVAAQFQPYERIILDWNEDGSVSVHKGISPVGDDPNDLLTNDFELTDLMGPEGREQWKKYIALKGKLANAKEKNEKFKIASEINKIGDLYNFSE